MTFSEAEQFLINVDSKLGTLIATHGTINHSPRTDYFASLTQSIISQQISVKAATKIYDRFKEATRLNPLLVYQLNEETIKKVGLSGQKARYLHDLAEHFVEDKAVYDYLGTLTDDEVIAELTKVKGIGVWTAQMFLMFTLVRPDIFAPDDRGLQIAVQRIFDTPQTPSHAEMETMAANWAPFRTTASWHLWRSLDNEPIL